MQFLIKYRYSDILLKKNVTSFMTCDCVGIIFVTSTTRYDTLASRYQIKFSVYIRGLIHGIPRNLLRKMQLGLAPLEYHKLI